MAEKKTLSAKAVVADIRAGLSNEELMGKYNLSPKGLDSLFSKLVRAELVTETEVRQRFLPPE